MENNKEKIKKLKKGLNNPNVSDKHKELMRKKIAELEVISKPKNKKQNSIDSKLTFINGSDEVTLNVLNVKPIKGMWKISNKEAVDLLKKGYFNDDKWGQIASVDDIKDEEYEWNYIDSTDDDDIEMLEDNLSDYNLTLLSVNSQGGTKLKGNYKKKISETKNNTKQHITKNKAKGLSKGDRIKWYSPKGVKEDVVAFDETSNGMYVSIVSGRKIPYQSIKEVINSEIIKDKSNLSKKTIVRKNDKEVNKHNYMMLGRLIRDNEYFLGNGNRSEKHLWAGDVESQISEMKKLWNELPKNSKPDWLSMNDILDYEKKMSKNKLPKNKAKGGGEIKMVNFTNETRPRGFSSDKGFEQGNIMVQRVGGSTSWNVAIGGVSKGRVFDAYTKEQALKKAKKDYDSTYKGGGEITLKKNKSKSKGGITTLAKQIREDDESWIDAMKRAGKILKGEGKTPIKRKAKKKTIKRKVRQIGSSNKKSDSQRTALKPGKRISKNGNVYYEYRANRSDINPKNKL